MLEDKDEFGVTPLIHACLNNNKYLVEVLLKKMKKLNLQENINITYDNNMSPLMVACAEGNIEVVKELLKSTVIKMYVETTRLEWQSHIKKTCFLIALENGHIECVQALLEKGYDVNYKLRSREAKEQLRTILNEDLSGDAGGGGGAVRRRPRR